MTADRWGLVLNGRVRGTNAEWTQRQQGSGAGPRVSRQQGLDQAVRPAANMHRESLREERK